MKSLIALCILTFATITANADVHGHFDPNKLEENETLRISGHQFGCFNRTRLPEITITRSTVSAVGIPASPLSTNDIEALSRYIRAVSAHGESGRCTTVSHYHLRKFRGSELVAESELTDRSCLLSLRAIGKWPPKSSEHSTGEWLTPEMIYEVISDRTD